MASKCVGQNNFSSRKQVCYRFDRNDFEKVADKKLFLSLVVPKLIS